MNIRNFFLILIAYSCLSFSGVLADVPHQINFQGTLTDSSGNPITGSRYIRFYLYADSTGGSPLWVESHGTVEITDGLFQVTLGSEEPLPNSLFDGSILWLAIQVSPDPAFSPRQPVVAVPYSFRAQESDHALDADLAGHAAYADTAAFALTGPGFTLPYSGTVSSTGNAFSVTNNGSGPAGYFDSDNGKGLSVSGDSYGVYSIADGIGVYGRSNSPVLVGVSGYNSAGGIGTSGSSSGNVGLLGSEPYAVYGVNQNENYGYLGGDSVGVYGNGNPYAGYFDGKVYVSDSLGIGTSDPDASLHVNGSVKLGANGTSFLEIKEITGTTLSSGLVTPISYPAGYDWTNTRILTLEVELSTQSWISIGSAVSSYFLHYELIGAYIRIWHGAGLNSKDFRIVLMKTS